MAIRDWPAAERPRERLAQAGRGGACPTPNCWRSSCASACAARARSIWPAICWRVSMATWPPGRRHTKELARLPGIGPAKAAQLAASLGTGAPGARRIAQGKDALASPQAVRDWLRLSLGNLQHEVFVALWLDAQNRLIASEELFRGTLTQTSVLSARSRQAGAGHNAGAVILAHNHPSGLAEPSRADEVLTSSLKQALALIDVKLLDHFIVTGGADRFPSPNAD
jgi:DNA repair protein RadC